MEFYHEPVMPSECIEALNIKGDGVYVDGTTGGGGHSLLIANKLKNGRLICVDRDMDALAHTKERLREFGFVSYAHGNYKSLKEILNTNGIERIDGLLIDCGVSSFQLDVAERGFSYMKDAPLDMRMDRSGGVSAFDVINDYGEKELTDIFFEYGEEKFAKRIAALIVETRREKPVTTTLELAALIDSAIPERAKNKGSHPAKRVFQAVRIEVNGELEGLKDFIVSLPGLLNVGGRIAVITFHSLEDRIIKTAFKQMQNPCICPRDLPVCACGKKSAGKTVFKKPILPSSAEIKRNPRSKSAKLRVFETM